MDAFSAPFKWTTDLGEFQGIAFAGDGYYRIHVSRKRITDGTWRKWETVNLDPNGNTITEFDEWRKVNTGYEPTTTPSSDVNGRNDG